MNQCHELNNEQILATLDQYKMRFMALENYDNSLCKLGVYKDCLYVEPIWFLQGIFRWIGSQSRANVYEYMNTELIEFLKFLEKCAYTFEVKNVSECPIKECLIFIQRLTAAFSNIQQIYPTYDKLNTLITNITEVLSIYISLFQRITSVNV